MKKMKFQWGGGAKYNHQNYFSPLDLWNILAVAAIGATIPVTPFNNEEFNISEVHFKNISQNGFFQRAHWKIPKLQRFDESVNFTRYRENISAKQITKDPNYVINCLIVMYDVRTI